MLAETVGAILAILNVLNAGNATYFFLCRAKVSVPEWLVYNACTPSTALYLLGYVLGSWAIMCMAIPALAFFGLGGLFFFGWRGMNIIPQISHMCMTAAIVWIVVSVVEREEYKQATIGLLAASVVITNLIAAQQHYQFKHGADFDRFMENAMKKSLAQ